MKKSFPKFLKTIFKKYFLVGLIVLLPFFVTFKILTLIISYFDRILLIDNGRFLFFIPERFHPDSIFNFHIPGLGFLFSACLILFVGAFSRNYLGKRMIKWGDSVLANIPLASTLYKAIKETLHTFTSRADGQQFSNVVLVEYPRKGIFIIGFVTSQTQSDICAIAKHDNLLNVFIPTTPNPTSGFLILVPKEDIQKIDISIEDAFKLIISGGMANNDINKTAIA